MLTERLQARVPTASNPVHYILQRYQIRFHKISADCSGKCNIVATDSEKDLIHGVMFDVADNQVCLLDKAEGVGFGYRKEELTLSIHDIDTKVLVYVAENDAIDEALVPYRWYYDLVLAGAEQHGLPADYIAGLRAVPFTQDPKSDRKGRIEALDVLKKYGDSKKPNNLPAIAAPHL